MANYNYPKIVVTGIGAITAIGNNVDEFWNGMLAGKSGAAPITTFDTTHFATKFACEIKDLDLLQFLNRKEVQRMDRFTQIAIAAAQMAMDDSEINLDKLDKERAGVVVGSGIGGMMTFHHQTEELVKREGRPDRISPFFIPMLISDITPGHIAIRWGLKGPNYGTVSACATSSHAIADALMLMQRGDADFMVVGGSEAVVAPMGVGGFNAMKALSTRNDSPETASRPFDKERDGFVIGEGAGILIFETLEHATNRGAKIYAEVAGFGLTDDAYHITQPAEEGEGAKRAMALAIKDAGLTIEDIDYINAHGTSTYFNDKNETIAIKNLFGEERARKIAISSTKSMTGHLLGAAGGVEAIASVLAIEHQTVPPTINLINPDPECDLNYTPLKPVKREIKTVLSNNFGFGGHNASICFKKFEE
ncbi:MAG: beta-ketoacyl-ACP synthase II [Ignavibacteria bacterium]|jgi:3-oxoacyl-[acyl-carrier-protein] synthase II|nr:beta-ketoacyl-ACP synthase II [Ignavibacteria bacterium]